MYIASQNFTSVEKGNFKTFIMVHSQYGNWWWYQIIQLMSPVQICVNIFIIHNHVQFPEQIALEIRHLMEDVY